MAVQQLAKDQAKKEKLKNSKRLLKDKEDDKNAEENAERYMELMDKIYNNPNPKFGAPPDMKNLPLGLSPKERGPGGPVLEAKRGGQVKCGVQMKGTSPLIKKRKGKK